MEKLGAVVMLAKPKSAAQIKNLAESLDLFDLAPGAHTPQEYGKYMIQQSGRFEYDENLDAFYDYEKYGTERMNAEDGMFTDRGYIAYKGYYQHGGSDERWPEQPHGDGRAFTMILYLTHGNGEESIPLKLPAASSQVEEIDIRLDDICSGEGNFRISDVKSSVKGLWQFIRSADLLDPKNLEKLNRFSRQLDAMSEKERQIFAGALLSECINSLDDVLQTVGRIGQYEMITEVTCDRELG